MMSLINWRKQSKLVYLYPTHPMKKVCHRCKEKKLISLFHNDRSTKDGYSASCAACRNKSKRKPKNNKCSIHAVEVQSKFPKEETAIINGIKCTAPKGFGCCNVPIQSDDIFTQLNKKFGRTYWIRVEADLKTEVRAYGDHSEQFKGLEPMKVIDKILG